MNRTRRYVAWLLVGLLAVSACSSDDTAPDTPGMGGSDSGADRIVVMGGSGGASGGAASDGASTDTSTGGGQPDAGLPEALSEPSGEAAPGDTGQDGAEGAAPDVTMADAGDAPSDATGDVPAACTGDLQCQGGTWRCELNTHTCVPCLPGATDNCPVGQYCTDAFACVPGCRSNAACTSGVCTNHECEHCQGDTECAAGHVCGTGVCGAACTPGTCPNGFDCCGGHCVDFARDIAHCGGCPNACTPTYFCSTTGCAAVVIANVCGNGQTTMLLDSYAPDNAANAVLQGALTANCAPPPTTSSIAQTSPGAINPSTGQPVAGGGNLITVAGGYYVHKVVDYLDQIGATPVYLDRSISSLQYRARGGGADAGADGGPADLLIAEMPWNASTAAHDLILIETVRDPASGTLFLIAFGQQAESTAAAARYVATQMLPNRATYGKSWYVYEWTAASDAGAEMFVLKGSGP